MSRTTPITTKLPLAGGHTTPRRLVGSPHWDDLDAIAAANGTTSSAVLSRLIATMVDCESAKGRSVRILAGLSAKKESDDS